WEHILITHHHSSHQNGNQAIKACRQKIEIIAGDDRVEGLDYKIKHFEGLQVGCMRFRFLYTPGHTNGHYCYYVESTRTKDR
ncbi:MBL fold metallo-hydrolase, partial [Streptococcus pyogenes]